MNKIIPVVTALFFLIFASSCAKKTYSNGSAAVTDIKVTTKPGESAAAAKPADAPVAKKTTVKTAVPKVIVVNDSVAKRAVDGRYYYDLEGRRYWRNNRDGKYYLFYTGMFEKEDFKAPVKQ